MASLLNMLNNFLGSPGKSSLHNLNSENIAQDDDFKDIIENLLNSGEGDQQILTGLLPSPNGGVDLPLPAAGGGNSLPPSLATATLGIDASLRLSDDELALSATLGSSTAPGESTVTALNEDGELLALQAAAVLPASTSAVTQPAPPTGSSELPLTPEPATPTNTAALQTLKLSGVDAPVNSTQNPVVENTLTIELVTPAVDPVARTGETDADATRPVKLDSAQQGPEQVGESTLDATLLPLSTASAGPAVVVSAPASSAIEVPGTATQAPAALLVDGRPQVAVASDPSVPGNATAPASTPAPQTPPQPAAPLIDVDLTAKGPQQFALEQALDNEASSDNDAPAELTRQTLVPPGPALRPAPAPLQAADPNFANVAAMLNQGQSINSLNERLQFMLLNGQNSAEIQLDPPELGSLQVRVTARHEQTSVIFVAPNTAVRDALEQQLPRLRDTLEGAGLQLQDASVFAQTEDRPDTRPQSYADAEAADQLIADELDEANRSTSGPRVSTQLVDAYI